MEWREGRGQLVQRREKWEPTPVSRARWIQELVHALNMLTMSNSHIKRGKEDLRLLKEGGLRKAAQAYRGAVPERGEKHPPANGGTAGEQKGRRGGLSHTLCVCWG